MGASAARITAENFLTPPELASYRLDSNGAGRIGGLRLELRANDGRTTLAGCYQQVPLRVLPPFQFPADQPTLLYLINPTAGLMDGDGQLVELSAGANSRAVVVGQSATRIHPSIHGFSTQQWTIRVEAGAVLVLLPGPAIPFQGCRYYQRAVVDLAEGAHFIWGDIWHSGRYARGAGSEQFQFAMLVQELLVQREGQTVFRDRFAWRGPWDRATAAWHFGDSPACGSLFVSADPRLNALFRDMVCFQTAAGDHCCRWQGSSEAVTAHVTRTALQAAAILAGGSEDRPWLLHNHDLAPNHWFSVAARASFT